MRSQAAGRGKIVPRCVPEGASDGKTPVRGNISPACIQIQLILARYAWHVSEKPRRAPLGNTPREHLAAKGRFRRPKPSNHARRTNLATLRWTCPCAGAPARAAASRDRLSTAWPLPRGVPTPPQRLANTCHSLYPPLLFKLNQTRPVGLGGSFRRKGTEHVKELRYGRGSLVPLQAAACLRGLRRALDSLHKLAAPDEQPKPRRAASCLRRKRLPNVRPDTLRLDRPHTPQPPARCR